MIVIATHNGRFHADDVFAVASLQLLLDGQETRIIRTRDKQEIKKADYVVDVGGEYNQNNNRFDHHQVGGAGKRKNKIPYASFGLVWARYGEQICAFAEVAKRIDQKLVQIIDAEDNGVGIAKPLFNGVRYYSINNIISLFIPTYKEKNISYDTEFTRAVTWARQILEREIVKVTDFIKAEEKIKEEYKGQEDEQIVIFDKKNSYEESGIIKSVLQNYPKPIYIVLYKKENDNWQAIAMNKNKNTFQTKKPFPKQWRGLKDKELADISGIKDAIFCHLTGFLCIAKSMPGAIKMAELALKE